MYNFSNIDGEGLNGKKIIITGGSTGIGRETTILLATLGADCLICGREEDPLKETEAAVLAKVPNAKIITTQCDISLEQDLEQLFDILDKQFGQIDILINNAALGYGSISEGNYEDWSYVIRTNLIGSMSATHHAVKRMRNAGKGHIINIGSMSAHTKEPDSSVYVATKMGLRGFSESLRKEVNEDGIKVSLIEPGAVDTDMQEGNGAEKLAKVNNKKMLKAIDIANAIAFCLLQPARTDIVTMQIRPNLQII